MEGTTNEPTEIPEELNQEEEEIQSVSIIITSPAKEELKLLVRHFVFWILSLL